MPARRRSEPQPGAHAAIQPGVVEQPARTPARPTADPGAAEARPALPGSAAVDRVRLGDGARADPIEDHVVDERAGARRDPRGGHERVARELRVEEEAPVVVGRAVGPGGPVRGRHRELEPRLAGLRGERAGAGLADGRAASRERRPHELRAGPADERLPLPRVQRALRLTDVGGRAGRRWPRRHPLRLEGGDERRRAAREIALGAERERGDATVLMAARARLAHDRRDVARKARRRGGRRGGRASAEHERGADDGGERRGENKRNETTSAAHRRSVRAG